MALGKRGSIGDIMIFIVLSFVIVTLLGFWVWGFDTMTNTLTSVDVNAGSFNLTNTTLQTFGEINDAQKNWIPIISLFMMFGMMLSILISSFLVRVHPVFIIPYLLVVVLGVVVSVYVSNAYEVNILNGVASGTFQSFTAVNYLIINLPLVVTIVGVFGMVILFAGIQRDRNLGGGIE